MARRADLATALLVLTSSVEENRRKPLLPLAGEPLLVHVLRLLARAGVGRCVIVLAGGGPAGKQAVVGSSLDEEQDADEGEARFASDVLLLLRGICCAAPLTGEEASRGAAVDHKGATEETKTTKQVLMSCGHLRGASRMHVEVVQVTTAATTVGAVDGNGKPAPTSSPKVAVPSASTTTSFSAGVWAARDRLLRHGQPFLLVSAAHIFAPSLLARALSMAGFLSSASDQGETTCGGGACGDQDVDVDTSMPAAVVFAETKQCREMARRVPTKARIKLHLSGLEVAGGSLGDHGLDHGFDDHEAIDFELDDEVHEVSSMQNFRGGELSSEDLLQFGQHQQHHDHLISASSSFYPLGRRVEKIGRSDTLPENFDAVDAGLFVLQPKAFFDAMENCLSSSSAGDTTESASAGTASSTAVPSASTSASVLSKDISSKDNITSGSTSSLEQVVGNGDAASSSSASSASKAGDNGSSVSPMLLASSATTNPEKAAFPSFHAVLQSLADRNRVRAASTEGRPWYCVEQAGLAAKLVSLFEDDQDNMSIAGSPRRGLRQQMVSRSRSHLSGSQHNSHNDLGVFPSTSSPHQHPEQQHHQNQHDQRTDPVLSFLQRMASLAEFEGSLPGVSLKASLLYVADVRELLWRHALQFAKTASEGLLAAEQEQMLKHRGGSGSTDMVDDGSSCYSISSEVEHDNGSLFSGSRGAGGGAAGPNRGHQDHVRGSERGRGGAGTTAGSGANLLHGDGSGPRCALNFVLSPRSPSNRLNPPGVANNRQKPYRGSNTASRASHYSGAANGPTHSVNLIQSQSHSASATSKQLTALRNIFHVLKGIQQYFAFPSVEVFAYLEHLLLQKGEIAKIACFFQVIYDQVGLAEPGPELPEMLRRVEEMEQTAQNELKAQEMLAGTHSALGGGYFSGVDSSSSTQFLQHVAGYNDAGLSSGAGSQRLGLHSGTTSTAFVDPLHPLGRIRDFCTRRNLGSGSVTGTSSVVPPPSSHTASAANASVTKSDKKKYFELLVVGVLTPEQSRKLRETLLQQRSAREDFIYSTVVVPSFEDAVAAVLVNHRIQTVLLLQDIAFSSTNELKHLQNWIGHEELKVLEGEIFGPRKERIVNVLARKLHDTLCSIDIFHLGGSEIFAGGVGLPSSRLDARCFKRVFHSLEQDCLEMHLSFLQAIQERATAPFFEALVRYANKPTGVFHALPLSRGNSVHQSEWIKDDFGEFYGQNTFLAETSCTIGGLDSLLDPSGVIQEAQQLAAKTFGAQKTFFGTSGTSTSNKIVLQALIQPGDIVLVDRNCHKSHHYGIVLQGAQVVYLEAYALHNYAFYGLVALDTILDALLAHKEQGTLEQVKLVLLTNCTFDGLVYNVEQVMEKCLAIKPDLVFVWDEAWFGFACFSPIYRRRTAMCAARRLRDKFRSAEYRRTWAGVQHALAGPVASDLQGEGASTSVWSNSNFHPKNGGSSTPSGTRSSSGAIQAQQQLLKQRQNNNALLLPDPAKVRVRCYATQSTHKTLSAFRQGSMIHIFDEDYEKAVEQPFHEAFMTHTSTSPNYQILASLDVARKQVALEGYALVQKSVERAILLRRAVQEDSLLSKYFHFLDVCDLVPNVKNLRSRNENEFTYAPEAGYSGLESSWRNEPVVLDPTRLTLFVARTGLDGDSFKRKLMQEFDVQVNKTSINTVMKRPAGKWPTGKYFVMGPDLGGGLL
eukprot:g11964.t1